ncbi:glycoside hydrolase [Pseudomonas serbica]|uniref:glycoside hydrolase n=1 Tax=Pseudomonas serbica TaxID=2965074 RepID=UPI0039E39A81
MMPVTDQMPTTPVSAQACSCRWITPVWAIVLACMVPGTTYALAVAPVLLDSPAGQFAIEPDTLAISLTTSQGKRLALASPAFSGSTVERLSDREWQVAAGTARYKVTANIELGALRVSVRSRGPYVLNWPRAADPGATKAYAFPFGEGSYVPADDPGWLDWMVRRYEPESVLSILSMPFWTELREGLSVTWLLETPLDTTFDVERRADRARPGFTHRFSSLSPDAAYTLRIVPGAQDPLAGAHGYRQWLQANGHFVSLNDKIAATPEVARLGGAPHIYLWGSDPLKVADIVQWRAFLEQFQRQQGDDTQLAGRLWKALDDEKRKTVEMAFKAAARNPGDIEPWMKREVVRALNAALLKVIVRPEVTPLPGGHDPGGEVAWARDMSVAMEQAFGPLLAPARRWGGGLSTDLVSVLQSAGLRRAWLGVSEWRTALWHPEAIEQAKAAGYLVGVYDSYGSAHPSNLAATWSTAQMGDELTNAGYRDQNGQPVTGFAGRGVYVSARAAHDYARKRIDAIAENAGLNSYFLDVDGAGPPREDYTPGRETSESQDSQSVRQRLAYPARAFGLVTGTEGGLSWYSPQFAFAQGMTTQPFAWMDPDMKDSRSPYYRGRYWPDETPGLYFKPVPLKPSIARYVRSPRFRLPLYQIALHDSVVTTHHWEYGSLKFSNEREATALLQLLYMVPPLYHLADEVLERDLPVIAAYDRIFRPLHERLFSVAMVDFKVLSTDRALQQSSYADGTRITVNFSSRPMVEQGATLPALAARVEEPGKPVRVHEMSTVFKTR